MQIIHKLPAASLTHAHCQYCDREIIFAPRVGWIEPFPGDTYDNCPDNDYGQHGPEFAHSGVTPVREPDWN